MQCSAFSDWVHIMYIFYLFLIFQYTINYVLSVYWLSYYILCFLNYMLYIQVYTFIVLFTYKPKLNTSIAYTSKYNTLSIFCITMVEKPFVFSNILKISFYMMIQLVNSKIEMFVFTPFEIKKWNKIVFCFFYVYLHSLSFRQ